MVLGGFVRPSHRHVLESGIVNDYQLNRLQSFVDPTADPQKSGYQLRQARITVGSGGLIGTGLFNGPQTNGRFVPEQQTDFIFTVAGEELGFLGSGLIVILYLTFDRLKLETWRQIKKQGLVNFKKNLRKNSEKNF